MTIDLRFFRLLPIPTLNELSRRYPEEFTSLGLSDSNHDFQLTQEEASTFVIQVTAIQIVRQEITRSGQNPGEISPAELMTRIRQTAERIRQRESRLVTQEAERFLERTQQWIDRIRPRQINLSTLFSAPQSFREQIVPFQYSSLHQMRTIDANDDRIVSQEEILAESRRELETMRRTNPNRAQNISDEDLTLQAQAMLTTGALEFIRMNEFLQTHVSVGPFADQIPAELDQFDLTRLDPLSTEERRQNNTFRVLAWMRSRLGNETLLSAERTEPLLQEHVIDLQALSIALATIREPSNEITNLRTWLQGFSPHFLVTEREFEEWLRRDSLNIRELIGAIPEARGEMSPLALTLRFFSQLAGEDGVLSREDLLHHQREAGNEQGRIFPALWTLFRETSEPNPLHSALMSEPEEVAVSASRFLSRAAVQLAYLQPARAEEIYEESRMAGIFSFARMVAEGLHAHHRAHASDQVPGYMHYSLGAIYGVTEGLWRLAFSSRHQFQYTSWRQRIRNDADRQLRERIGALNLLRGVVRSRQLNFLTEALPFLRHSHPQAAELLNDPQFNIREIEHNYHIPNPRMQEEAWLTFSRRVLRNGEFIDVFRNPRALFLSPWQNRNEAAARSIYENLIQHSRHQQVVDAARSDLFDLNGDGGSLFPTFWFRNWADGEASFDGLWDGLMGGAIGLGLAFGVSKFLGMLTRPGSAFAQWVTRFEFSPLRSHPRRAVRALYWGLRVPHLGLTLPFQQVLNPEEVQQITKRSLRLAERPGFINQLRISMVARRLAINPNAEVAAAQTLRLADRIEEAARGADRLPPLESTLRVIRESVGVSSSANPALQRMSREAFLRQHEQQLRQGSLFLTLLFWGMLDQATLGASDRQNLPEAEWAPSHIRPGESSEGSYARYTRTRGTRARFRNFHLGPSRSSN